MTEGHVVASTPSAPPVTDVQVMMLAGQSNMSGRAEPASKEVLDPRVFQFGAHRRVIEPAPGLLDMHDVPTGMSYALTFAREWASELPASSVVLLIPGAHGSTGFTTTTQQPPPAGCSTSEGGTWEVGNTGSTINLYDCLLEQTTAGLIAAREHFRAAAVTVQALLWHQGENDALNQIDEVTYSSHLRTLIRGVRAHVGDPDLPILIGGMSPEWMRTAPGSAAVHRAHLRVARTVARTSFIPGRPGTGQQGDAVHYGRDGAEHLGIRTAHALRAIMADRTGTIASETIAHG